MIFMNYWKEKCGFFISIFTPFYQKTVYGLWAPFEQAKKMLGTYEFPTLQSSIFAQMKQFAKLFSLFVRDSGKM